MRGNIYKNSEGFIGSNGGTSGGSSGGGGGANTGDIIAAGGEVVGSIITAISGVRDANLRRKFEERLALLDKEQEAALGKQLLEAQTQTERTRILAQALSQTSQQRIGAFYGKGSEVALWIVGGAILLGVGFLLYKKVKSKR